MFQCVDKPTRCNTSYELYCSLNGCCVDVYIHVIARLACTNVPMRYTVYEIMLLMMDW